MTQKICSFRGKEILEQLSSAKSLTEFENAALSSIASLHSREEKGGIFEFRKKICNCN